MISSPKAIGNSIFAAATMTAFTVPGAGPFLAAAIAGGQAIFDIFYNDDGTQDPGDMTVTGNELSQAVNDVKAAITDGNLKNDLDLKFNTVETLFTSNLAPHWKDAAAGGGPALVDGGGSNFSESDWVNDMTTDLRTPITGNQPLLDATTFVKGHPSIKYDSLPLFIYAATAYVLFCKINVMWEYARIVRANDTAQALRDKANQAHAAAYRTWMRADPATRGPAPALPPAVAALLPKDAIQSQSHYVQAIHDQMDKVFIPWLEGVIDDLQAEFMNAHNELDSRVGQIFLLPAENVPKQIYDSGTGKKFDIADPLLTDSVDDAGFNQMRRDFYTGGIRAEIYYRRIMAKNLQDFTVPVRLQHKAILAHWKECRDNAYKFLQDYPVPANSGP